MNLYKYYTQPEILSGYNDRTFLIPYLAYGWLLNNTEPKSDVERAEKCIAKEGYFSYEYANNVLGRFKLGEPAIAKNAVLSLQYADEVLYGRFELAEPYIKKMAAMNKNQYMTYEDYDEDMVSQIHAANEYIKEYL